MSLWINPESVVFNGVTLAGVRLVRIDRKPKKTVTERGDTGGEITFADSLDPQTSITIERDLFEPLSMTPEIGATGELSFEVTSGSSDGMRRRISATVVAGASTILLQRGRAASQHQVFMAISSDGLAPPISITEAP